jgi:uncharacterized membrane protein (DUF441 family)
MWLPGGGLAGLLWSIGNVSSILSVAYLGGEGVGYSIVQSQLVVAGLWGSSGMAKFNVPWQF